MSPPISRPRGLAPKAAIGRRTFVAAASVAGLPLFLPARRFGATAPSNRIRVGQIGCGRMRWPAKG